MSDLNFDITRLGECSIPSPMKGAPFVDEEERLIYNTRMNDTNPFISQIRSPVFPDRAFQG